MNKKKAKIIALSVIGISLVLLIIWIAWGNTALELNSYNIASNSLPKAFDGFRIAHISDFHNTEIGKNNERLISTLEDAEPDIIVITGDMIDSRNTKVDIALSFAEQAIKIAPCYYVAGNHESRVDEYIDLKEGLIKLGVTVLEDEKTEIIRSEESITIVGVSDPSFDADYQLDDNEAIMNNKLSNLISEEDGYVVLLSHRPELFDYYVENNADLVFSGHAHGGQFRIPFIGGIAAPNQGVFPKYDAGIFTEKNTNMVVSRGIGNSLIPFRVNNRPEVILIELTAENN